MAATRIKRREVEVLRKSSRCAIDKPKTPGSTSRKPDTANNPLIQPCPPDPLVKLQLIPTKLQSTQRPATGGKDARRYLKRTQEDLEDSHLEGALWGWFRQRCAMGLRPSRTHVRTKAEQVAAHLGLTNFCPTDAWLDDFCLRHNLRCAGTSRETLNELTGNSSTDELLTENRAPVAEQLQDRGLNAGNTAATAEVANQQVLDAIRVVRNFAMGNDAPTDIHDAIKSVEAYVNLLNAK